MKAFRTLGVLVTLALACRLIVGCGGTGGQDMLASSLGGTAIWGSLGNNMTPEGRSGGMLRANDSGVTSALGAVDGFIYRDARNILTLGCSGILPLGARAVSGATVGVVGLTTTVHTDARGYFLLNRVPAGLRRLSVTPVGTAPSAYTTFPLTVLANATIRVGTPPISRAQAISKVLQSIGTPNPRFTFILAPQQPLPAGVTVAPALAYTGAVLSSAVVYRTPRPQWLVYVNDQAFVRFAHLVRYFLVDAATGALTVRTGTSWPALNAVNYYASLDVDFTSPDLVQAPKGTAPILPHALAGAASSGLPAGEATTDAAATQDDLMVRDHVPGCTRTTTYALLIQGSDNFGGDQKADMTNIKHLFGHGGIPPALVNQIGFPRTSTSPRAEAIDAFNKICQKATPCDTVFLYITAHGEANGFADLERTDADGNEASDEKLFPRDFDFTKCRACHVIVIIETCYSGIWLSPLTKQLDLHPGLKYIIMTASVASEESVAIPWYKPGTATGAIFTNELLTAFDENVAGHFVGDAQALLGSSFRTAQRRLDTDTSITLPDQVSKQHPLAQSSRVAGTCGSIIVSPTPTPTPTPRPTLPPPPPPTPTPPPPTPTPTATGTVPAVQLEHPAGTHQVGETIKLSRITGGFIDGAGPGCAFTHFHGTLTIDGQGSFPDPDPDHCGWGPVTEVPR